MNSITTNELESLIDEDKDIEVIDIREDFEITEGIIPCAKIYPLSHVA